MIELPVRIRVAGLDRETAAAWLLPGDSPAQWFCEWTRWQVPLPGLRLLPIAGIGVLTIPAEGTPAPQTLRAIPLRSIGQRLFLPAGAVLSPELTADEALALIPAGFVAGLFWPALGLVVPQCGDWLRVADLLVAPAETAVDWRCTRPGERLNDRLDRIDPLEELVVEQILTGGGDEIATRDDLTDLPPRPNEPGDGVVDHLRRALQQAAGKVAAKVSQKLRGVAGQVGEGAAAGAGSLLGPLANWSAGLVQKVSRELEELRQREFLRLLQLLKQNPDEGLKYAIEMGDGSHRGVAPPGGRLSPHGVDFQLNRPGGTPSADYWSIPVDYRALLIQQYRTLANRELQLKRYRRAAYIFAQLLGDYSSAAAALRAGRHFREAAIVYRDRLKQPLEAGACFAEGGLLHDAIALYEDLGDHETVGDLHSRLEQPDQAREAWLRAIDTAITHQSDYVKAAAIALNKLQSPDLALEMLETGWKSGHSMRECLTQQFAIYERDGRHAEARKTLAELRSGSGARERDTVAVEVLSLWVGRYPDVGVVELAADTARVLASRHLRHATSDGLKRLTVSLTRLNPGDLLLARDARRYAESEKPQTSHRKAARPKSTSWFPIQEPVRTLSLPITEVAGAIFTNGDVFAAGTALGAPALAGWHPATDQTWALELQPRTSDARFQFAQDDRGTQPFLLTSRSVATDDGAVRLGSRVWQLPPSGTLPLSGGARYQGRTPHKRFTLYGTLTNSVAICYAQRLVWHLVVRGGDLVALGMDPTGKIAAPYGTPVKSELICEIVDPQTVRAQGNSELLVIACDNQLRLFSANSTASLRCRLEQPVSQLALTSAFSEQWIVAGMTTGAWIMAPAKGLSQPTPLPFVEDWNETRVGFTARRQIVVVSSAGGCLFRLSPDRIDLKAKLSEFASPPVAVVSFPKQSHFAVIESDGTVQVFAEQA